MGLRITDKRSDLFRRVGAAAGKVSHFARDDGKPAPLLARARRFHGGVKRQDIGLEGNTVDHAQDVGDARRAAGDIAHFFNHVADHFAAVIGRVGHRLRQLVRLLGVIGVELHRRGDLFHAGRRLLQRRGGGFRTLGKIAISQRQLAATGVNLRAGIAYPHNRVHQRLSHLLYHRVEAVKLLARGGIQRMG